LDLSLDLTEDFGLINNFDLTAGLDLELGLILGFNLVERLDKPIGFNLLFKDLFLDHFLKITLENL
jgi:hypothetical protein